MSTWRWYLIAQALVALDPVLTWLVLMAGGQELHPFWDDVIYTVGPHWFVVFRVVVGIWAIHTLASKIPRYKYLTEDCLIAVSWVWACICTWNLLVLGYLLWMRWLL